jgi:hypothetical protein
MPALARRSLETKTLFFIRNKKAAWDQDPRRLSFCDFSRVLGITAHRSLLPLTSFFRNLNFNP